MTMQDLGHCVWHDLDGTGYIGLDLTVIPTPQKQVIEGIELHPKDEYHCSLVDVRHYIGDDEPSEEQRIGKAAKEYLRECSLRFAGLGEERYLCRKEDRKTLVDRSRSTAFRTSPASSKRLSLVIGRRSCM